MSNFWALVLAVTGCAAILSGIDNDVTWRVWLGLCCMLLVVAWPEQQEVRRGVHL